jgi:hypothetical protein
MEVFMFEDYYIKPSTSDRIRAIWLAPQIELLGMAAGPRLLSPRCVSPVAAAFSLWRVRTEEGVQRHCFLQGSYKGVRIAVVGATRSQDKDSRCAVRKHAIDAECGVRQMLQLACKEPVTRNRRRGPFSIRISGSGVC